jgi:hypothetical protein
MMVSQPAYGHGGNARTDEEPFMTDALPVRPDAYRVSLLRSVFAASALDAVAEAVAVATEHERRIYIEHVDDRWRWSFTHPGGGYPLLRVTARFLGTDYTLISIAFRTVTEGVCVLCADPDATARPDRWAVIEFDGPATPKDVEELILCTSS